jgi:hypothetical protein
MLCPKSHQDIGKFRAILEAKTGQTKRLDVGGERRVLEGGAHDRT